MQRRRLLGLGVALAVCVGAAACDVRVNGEGGLSFDVGAGRAQDTWTRTYTLAEGGRLELINVNGRISAEPASGAAVELAAERIAKASSDEAAKDLLGQVEMREEVGPGEARVEVRGPRSFRMGGIEVRWTVKVPKGVAVDLRNTNGKVQLTALTGEVRARTVNGGVEATGLAVQSIEASTVNGGVDVEVAEPLDGRGTVSLESVNGGVRLAIPDTSRASLVARVTNGGIDVGEGLAFQQTGERSRRRFEGTLNGGGTSLRLETTNGGVRLSRVSSPSHDSR
jgi:hypothetical protein